MSTQNTLIQSQFRLSARSPQRWGGVLLALSLLLTGCLSRPSLHPQSFSFSLPALTSNIPAHQGRILSISRFQVDAPYDSQSFVYRTGDFSYEQDPYAQFLVSPAESLAEPIRAYFRHGGIFQDVTEPGSEIRPDTLLEIAVVQLYGDFRARANPAAVLQIRFTFLEASNSVPGRVLFEKVYLERSPLRARTAAAVMAGWNQALQSMLAKVTADLKHNQAFKP